MLIRFFLGLILLTALFYFVGLAELIQVFAEIRLDFVLYLFLLAGVMIWASCLKWRLFIRASGTDVPLLHLMRLYTIGYFFNTFLPSYVGGDIARSYHLGQYIKSQRDALVATFLERFTGLLAMALLGVIFVLIGSEITSGLGFAIFSVAIIALLVAACFFSEKFGYFSFQIVRSLIGIFERRAFIEKVKKLVDVFEQSIKYAREDKVLLLRALYLSFLFHLLTVVNTYLAARAIGWSDPSVSGLFVVVPLVLLVSMAPVTPSGLGIQEGAFLYLLTRIGASQSQGLGVGLVLRAKVMVLAVIGGLLWLSLKNGQSITKLKSTVSAVKVEAHDLR